MRAWVDGIRLSVTYTVPDLKGTGTPVTGILPTCTVAAAYNDALPAVTCPVLRGTGATAKMAIKGTVYVPLGAVDLSMTGQLNAVTQRGIVARTLHLGLTPGATYTVGLVTLPGSENRQVLLTAVVAGVPRLRAEVTIDDALGAVPGTSVTVNSWSVVR